MDVKTSPRMAKSTGPPLQRVDTAFRRLGKV